MVNSKRGQIWVETVLYTLIAFILISLVLSIARPKIEEIRDNAILEQTAETMRGFDNLIRSPEFLDAGNKREIELGLKKGYLKIDGINNQLAFEMECGSEFSEPGQDVADGNLILHTRQVGEVYHVNMTIDYDSAYDFTINGENETKQLGASSIPYTIFITNKGGSDKTVIDFEIN